MKIRVLRFPVRDIFPAMLPVQSVSEMLPVEVGENGSERAMVRAPVPIVIVPEFVLVPAIVIIRGRALSSSLIVLFVRVTPSNTPPISGVSPVPRTLSVKGIIQSVPLAVATQRLTHAMVTPESILAVTPVLVAKERTYASTEPLEFKSALTALVIEFVATIPSVTFVRISQVDPFFSRRKTLAFHAILDEVTR